MPSLIYSTSISSPPSSPHSIIEPNVNSWNDPAARSKAAEAVAQAMYQDGRACRNVYLISHQRHLSAHPVSCDDDALRKVLKAQCGGYEPREYHDIRRAYNLHTEWPALPMISLDAELQTHFAMLERTPTTCHPMQICEQVAHVVGALYSATETNPRKNTDKEIARLAKAVFAAGTSDVRYSRSVALFVHQLLADLKTLTRDLKASFRKQLLDLVFRDFRDWWKDTNMHETGISTDIPFGLLQNGLTPSASAAVNQARTKMLRCTIFLGDLFSIGLADLPDMCGAVWYLVNCPRSLFHLRALCTLLSRCVYSVHTRFDREFLVACGRELPQRLVAFGGYYDEWAQRWWIEICRMLERMIDAVGQDQRHQWKQQAEGQAVKHRWDSRLNSENIFEQISAFADSCSSK